MIEVPLSPLAKRGVELWKTLDTHHDLGASDEEIETTPLVAKQTARVVEDGEASDDDRAKSGCCGFGRRG